jgi:hypothetical protein
MRLVAKLLWVLTLLLPIAGCNDVGVPPETATLELFVAIGGTDSEPNEGVSLCQTETENCDLSDERGRATIQLPPDEEISYTLEKDGSEKQLRADVASGPLTGRANVWPDEAIAGWYQALNAQYPPTDLGNVYVTVNDANIERLAGATLELVGATGIAYYEEQLLNPSTELEATTEEGAGGFLGVTPGERKIELGGTAQGCIPILGWPSDEPNRIRFPVREGYLTVVTVRCSVQP